MTAVPKSVGVFVGQVDKRPKGWYWVDAKSEKSKQAIRGPFETKKQAVDDALAERGQLRLIADEDLC
jgi:hypothetical protein